MYLVTLLFLVSVVNSDNAKKKWSDPSLNTPENNAKIIEKVKQGHHHEHSHDHGHHHDHSHDHGHHHDHSHDHGHAHHHGDEHGDGVVGCKCKIWMKAFGSTMLISIAPFIILYFIPIDKRNEKQENFLKVLLAFASGGLLGDAFLHLLPHAINPHTHGDGHDHHGHDHHGHDHHGHDHHGHSHGAEMTVGLWTLAGLLAFLLVEKFVMAIKGGHSHSHGPPPADEKKKEKCSDDESETKPDKSKTSKYDESESSEGTGEVKVSAYLNMAADMAHNFTDGLAIGSSFLISDKMGYLTTFLILVHEIPHEIGDFAILVQSGFNKRSAMNFQLVTALGALLGTGAGLIAESFFSSATQWILPFTAGGFIYIATVSVIPELLEGASSLWQSFKEITALCIGIGLMVIIAEYE